MNNISRDILQESGKLQILESSLQQDEYISHVLPGFNADGQSWLSLSISLSRSPGEMIKSLERAIQELTSDNDTDINWPQWMDKHLNDTSSKQFFSRQGSEAKALSRLTSLINETYATDPSFTDVIMLGQLQDCCQELGISRMINSSVTQKDLAR